MAYDENIAGCL